MSHERTGRSRRTTPAAALHLGAGTGPVVGFVEQDGGVRGQDARRPAAREDEIAELPHQVGRGEGRLAVVLVDVEMPSCSSVSR